MPINEAPRGHKTHAVGEFPTTRDEALRIGEMLIEQMAQQGCVCRSGVKIEFIKPPGGDGYIYVEHSPLCPLARTS